MYSNRNNFYSAYTNPVKQFFFSNRSVLSQLILINVIVWFSVNLLNVFFYLLVIKNFSVISYFAVPADLKSLLLKPWTIFTYMFLHEDFFHILFNMISLYFGGKIFLLFLDEKKLLNTYIFGGLTGGFLFILSYNVFPVFHPVVLQSICLGASASIVAIIVATATYAPKYKVNLFLLGSIEMKFIALSMVALFTLSINKENPGGHLAHLGGAFWGFLYVMQLKKGKDIYYFFNTVKSFFKINPKLRVERNEHKRPVSDEEYNRKKREKQERIDTILEKISQSGYSSLTKEEKDLLFDSSKKS